MDRFIAIRNYITNIPKYNLKSNMDRFIDEEIEIHIFFLVFKIQYGQIYSGKGACLYRRIFI